MKLRDALRLIALASRARGRVPPGGRSPRPVLIRRLAAALASALLALSAAAAHWPLTGNLGAHDPSVIQEGELWWCFSTGPGLAVKYSHDGLRWEQGVPLFSTELPWWRNHAPAMGFLDVWAPDIHFFNNRFWCYYSVSEFGTNNSAIGLKSCTSILAGDWRDDGLVLGSKHGADTYNAIDPGLTLDAAGRPWLAFGARHAGVHLVRLDPATMKPVGAVFPLASRVGGVEGPHIVHANGYYHLFVSVDCASPGGNTASKIACGRSAHITGPYVDEAGTSMLVGGCNILDRGDDRWRGPGCPDIFRWGNHWAIARHAYDAHNLIQPTLRISDLRWDAAGWPVCTADPVGPARCDDHACSSARVNLQHSPGCGHTARQTPGPRNHPKV